MNNVLPFPTLRAATLTPAFAPAFALDDDDEIALQRWELVMSGQRGSQEYQRLEALGSRKLSTDDVRRPHPVR